MSAPGTGILSCRGEGEPPCRVTHLRRTFPRKRFVQKFTRRLCVLKWLSLKALTCRTSCVAVVGEGEQARRHWERALTLYTQLGAPEADQVRSQLAHQQAEQAGPRASQATR
jgi:membrane protein required for beta-lactamase induction